MRWTIGQTTPEAIHSLQLSIKLWRKIYGQTFDMVICYNKDKPSVDEDLLDQNKFINSLPVPPLTTAWKLYPPRIDIDSHEIFIDNDVIVHSPLSVINPFLLSSDLFFITEAWERSYGYNDHIVPSGFIVNSGLFGIPPGFNFHTNLCLNIKPWASHFDEQGLVASVLCNCNTTIIPLSDIRVCMPEASFGPTKCGLHFVGLNNGHNEHWHQFLLANLM